MWKNIYNNQLWDGTLPVKWAGRSLRYFDTLDSTNLEAVRAAKAGACHGTLIVADRQTDGRGRRGRTWESPAGKNLYFSLILRPQWSPEKASMVTLVMANSVARSIEQQLEYTVTGIKWPNDILLNGKKICGILTEMCLQQTNIDYIIVGVGINVKEQEFEGELFQKASSLNQEGNMDISREDLLQRIMIAFEEDYELFEDAGDLTPLLSAYQCRLLNKDQEVIVMDLKSPFEGVAKGITKNGELIVEKTDQSICHVYAGEVSIRGKQGYI